MKRDNWIIRIKKITKHNFFCWILLSKYDRPSNARELGLVSTYQRFKVTFWPKSAPFWMKILAQLYWEAAIKKQNFISGLLKPFLGSTPNSAVHTLIKSYILIFSIINNKSGIREKVSWRGNAFLTY